MHFGASPAIFERARQLRKRTTQAEKELWKRLSERKLLGFKFRRQHPAIKYVLDFYCHALKLCIEIDGGIHDDKYQKFYDDDRTKNLKERGIRVIRLSNEEIMRDIERVLKEIQRNMSGLNTKEN